MKQKMFIFLLLLGLAMFCWADHIDKKKVNHHHKKIVTQLVDFLNSRMEGNRFELNLDDSIVTPVDKDRYQIVLKDIVYHTDLSRTTGLLVNNLTSGDFGNFNIDSGRMKEMSLVYNIKNNHIQMSYIKELSVVNEMKDTIGKPIFGDWRMSRIRASIGSLTYEPVKNKEIGIQETTMEHLKIVVTSINPYKEEATLSLDVSKIGKVDVGEEDNLFNGSLLDKDTKVPDLQIALKKGKALNDLTVHLGAIDVLLTINDRIICQGNIKNATYSQFEKPEKSRKTFEKGMGIGLKEIRLSFPGNEKLQLAFHVDELNFKYSLNNVSLAAAQVYYKIQKKSFTNRNQVDSAKMRELMALKTQFMMEMLQSRSLMQFSINPLKHYFGKMNVTAVIKLYNLMAGPMFSITFDLFDSERVLDNLEKSNLIPMNEMNIVRQYINHFGKKNNNGDVKVVLEWDLPQFLKMFSPKKSLLPPAVRDFIGVSQQ